MGQANWREAGPKVLEEGAKIIKMKKICLVNFFFLKVKGGGGGGSGSLEPAWVHPYYPLSNKSS